MTLYLFVVQETDINDNIRTEPRDLFNEDKSNYYILQQIALDRKWFNCVIHWLWRKLKGLKAEAAERINSAPPHVLVPLRLVCGATTNICNNLALTSYIQLYIFFWYQFKPHFYYH